VFYFFHVLVKNLLVIVIVDRVKNMHSCVMQSVLISHRIHVHEKLQGMGGSNGAKGINLTFISQVYFYFKKFI